jgi:hypothetical protein
MPAMRSAWISNEDESIEFISIRRRMRRVRLQAQDIQATTFTGILWRDAPGKAGHIKEPGENAHQQFGFLQST